MNAATPQPPARGSRVLFWLSVSTALLLGFTVLFQRGRREAFSPDADTPPPPAPSLPPDTSSRTPTPESVLRSLFDSEGLRDWMAIHRPTPVPTPLIPIEPSAPPPVPSPAPTPTPGPTPTAARPWIPRYAGSYQTLRGARRGFLDLRDGKGQRIVDPGDEINGYRVRELSPAFLLLERNGVVHKLPLDQPIQMEGP